MLLLGTTDSLRIITASAADIDVYAAFVDINGTTVTVQNPQKTPGIVTATTTTIVAAPGSGIRNVKRVVITNNHASASTVVDIEVFDGTNPTEQRGVNLLPGENLDMTETGEWHHRDAQGAEYAYTATPNGNLGVAGTIAETIPRHLCPEVNTAGPATGTLAMMAIYLQAGQLVSTIDLWSATTAAGTPTNYAAGLYDENRALLANSANKLTEAWAANSLKSFAMLTPFKIAKTGLYYIGYYMTATTVATLKGGTAKSGGQLSGAAPIIYGTSNTGLTTALPGTANPINFSTASIYAAVR